MTSSVTLNHIRFVFYHNIKDNERNLCQDLLTIDSDFESARASLCKWATCTRQIFLSKTFANSLNMQKQYVKIVWEKTYDAYSLSMRVQTTITIFRFFRFYVFYHNIIFFFQSASSERHCATHWSEQRGWDLVMFDGVWLVHSEHAHASYPGLFFRPPAFSP